MSSFFLTKKIFHELAFTSCRETWKRINLNHDHILQVDGGSEFSHEPARAGHEWKLHCERLHALIFIIISQQNLTRVKQKLTEKNCQILGSW